MGLKEDLERANKVIAQIYPIARPQLENLLRVAPFHVQEKVREALTEADQYIQESRVTVPQANDVLGMQSAEDVKVATTLKDMQKGDQDARVAAKMGLKTAMKEHGLA